ncbi:hypothetical protein B0H19DRAFT_1285418 [Mycena capillaripes]|nr:hypothetical protein B0H19DRAFT_1285418 [Mycena capillaripes]
MRYIRSLHAVPVIGIPIHRTWGLNEVTTANGVYFHLWSGKTATVNTGANGLGILDTVIAAAKAHGIRLIIARYARTLFVFPACSIDWSLRTNN